MRRLLTLLLLIAPATFSQTITWTNVHQPMDGFGAGTGFDDIVCSPSCGHPSATTAASDMFFSSTIGIGLEWVKTSPGPTGNLWDLTWLQGALARGAKVSMVMGAPPASMMSDGVYHSTTGHLLNTNYTAYANFIVTTIQNYQSNGVTITNLSVQNEPDLSHSVWTGCSAGTIATCLRDFIKNNLGPALATAGLNTPLILGDTSGWFNSDYITACMNDSGCAQYVTIYSSHAYDGANATWGFTGSGSYCCATPTVPSEAGVAGSRHLWQTEVNGGASAVGCNGNLWTFDASMADALVWAHQFWGYLTIAQVNGEFYWNLFNYNGSNCNDGLTGPSSAFTPAKRLYVMGQWSKFVKSGWVRIDATACSTGVYCTAFKDPIGGNFAIVAVNTNGSGTSQTFNLSSLPTPSNIHAWVTDATHSLTDTGTTPLTGTNLTFTLAPSSVTTFAGSTSPGTFPWLGILASNRAVDWSLAGIPTGIPSSTWTQCGSTVAAGTSNTTINTLFASCANNTYLLLGAGTFNLTGGINIPSSGHKELRGQGAALTKLVPTSNSGAACGSFVCVQGNSSVYRGVGNGSVTTHNVTGGLSQGSTVLTLDSVAGITANTSALIMTQCDTGYSGAACTTGSPTDNSGYFECVQPWTSAGHGCAVPSEGPNGPSWRCQGTGGCSASTSGLAWQQEEFLVTAVNGLNVTLNRPIHHANWNVSQSPQVIVSTPTQQAGIRNLTIDASNDEGSVGSPGPSGINLYNCYQCWVQGVAIVNAGGAGVSIAQGLNSEVLDSYFYGNPVSYGDNHGIGSVGGSFNLFQNNICQSTSSCIFNDGPEDSDVEAYNYATGMTSGLGANGQLNVGCQTHSAGNNWFLFEGNQWVKCNQDLDHGVQLSMTYFRNFFPGWESWVNGGHNGHTSPTNAVYPITSGFGSRYLNYVGNVFGTPGIHITYVNTNIAALNQFGNNFIYVSGAGNQSGSVHEPGDPLAWCGVNSVGVSTFTGMCWGNYDTVTNNARWCGNSSDIGWTAVCGSASEIPTSALTYPNAVPTIGDTAIGQGAMPASFYLASKPAWVGSSPWPLVGPDVTTGNIGQCSGTLNVTSQAGEPTSDATKCSTGIKNAAWGNHVNENPAQQCYRLLGGLPDGSGPALTFTCKYPLSGIIPNAPNPSCAPGSGTYGVPQSVTCTDTAPVMCWTTDGTDPSTDNVSSCDAGNLYTTAISISATSTLKVIAGGTGFLDSSVITYSYIINAPAVAPAPYFFAGD